MRIKLINHLTKPEISDEYIRQIIAFCKPAPLLDRYVIMDYRYFWTNKDDHRVKGSHQPHVEKHRVFNYNEIRIRCRKHMKPIVCDTVLQPTGYLDFTVLDQNEFFVFITSHELIHQLQDDIEVTSGNHHEAINLLYELGKGGNPTIPIDEYQADRYALQKVREWRTFMSDSYIYEPKEWFKYEEK